MSWRRLSPSSSWLLQSLAEKFGLAIKRLLAREEAQNQWRNPDGFLQGVYLSCHLRFEPFFGHEEVEILGKTDYDFVSRAQGDLFRSNDLKVINSGVAHTNEERVPFASDGHEELLEAIKTPVHDRTGQLIGVLGIVRDITTRVQPEEERRSALERMVQSISVSAVQLTPWADEYWVLLPDGMAVGDYYCAVPDCALAGVRHSG